jgi:hypothetical protein
MARSTAIKLDFLADIARIAGTRLTGAGYTVDPNDPPQVTLRRYLNVRMRRIQPAKRTTYKARAFSCPSDHQAGLDLLIKKSEAGDDLRANQSTSLDNPDFNDAILHDWNISHFHLGTSPDRHNPSFGKRTGPVLFAFVTNDSLYCIDVLPSGPTPAVEGPKSSSVTATIVPLQFHAMPLSSIPFWIDSGQSMNFRHTLRLFSPRHEQPSELTRCTGGQ